MSETKLFPSKKCKGYFGIKRFDRSHASGISTKTHMLTAAALLELDFEQPNLDYHTLMKLTKILTHDDPFDMEKIQAKKNCWPWGSVRVFIKISAIRS